MASFEDANNQKAEPYLAHISSARQVSRLSFPQAVKPYLHDLVHVFDGREPRLIAGVAAGALVVLVICWWIVRRLRPSADELERRRRESISMSGRITDGYLVDARSLNGDESVSPTPEVLFYSYRLAGVTYNCAQDVSHLPERVRGFRLDQAVQVRYDPRNPGNSILVSESWSGLWLRQITKEPTPQEHHD
jgi:hypothetical protein